MFQCENEIRIVLIGRTGNGKSATGNSIIKKKDYFASQLSPGSVTQKVKSGETERNGKKVIVVDTPGLFDTKTITTETRKEIAKCIAVSTPGPHAIIYVLSIKHRWTSDEIDTFLEMCSIFGENLYDYLILLFTGKDELITHKIKFKRFLNEMPDFLKKVLKKCNGRCIAFNNHEKSPEEIKEQTDELFNIIDKIELKNNKRCYSTQMIQEAEQVIKEKIDQLLQEVSTEGDSFDEDIGKLRTQLREEIREEILTEGDILKSIKTKCSILQYENKRINMLSLRYYIRLMCLSF